MQAPVLVVEDDIDIRLSLRVLLEDDQYRVDEAPDGRPALECLRTSPEGMVVLLDLQMPGMDGLALLRCLAAEPSLLARHAFIVMTAYSKRTLPLVVAQLLVEQGIPILAKPFELHQVLALVRQAQVRLQPDTSPPRLDPPGAGLPR
jgi:CheY-like chemotaxis protein